MGCTDWILLVVTRHEEQRAIQRGVGDYLSLANDVGTICCWSLDIASASLTRKSEVDMNSDKTAQINVIQCLFVGGRRSRISATQRNRRTHRIRPAPRPLYTSPEELLREPSALLQSK